MQKLYVVTIKYTPESAIYGQVIGATTDAAKISEIINNHVNSIIDTLDDNEKTTVAYITDPNRKWHVDDLAIGKVLRDGKGHFGVEIAATVLI